MSGDELREPKGGECNYQNALAEIEQLNAALDAKITICGDEKIRELNAKVAMMREAIKPMRDLLADMAWDSEYDKLIKNADTALSATEQDVTRWVNVVKAGATDEVLEYCQEIDGDLWVNADLIRDLVKQLRGEK